MRNFLAHILQFLARLILKKYHPTIVAITGSVGKTSTKEALFAVLAAKFSVRASFKNYNNELGVPLTIIGSNAPGKSPWRWCAAFLRALWLLVWPEQYPAILVLEMAADHPKDIAKLVALAPPNIGVVTAVAPVHTEFFGSVEKVAREKRRLVEAVPKQGTVVLNTDDPVVAEFAKVAKGKVLTYGMEQEAEIRAGEISEQTTDYRLQTTELGSIHFKILHGDAVVPIHLPNVLGRAHVYAALAAAAVGKAFGLNMVEISQALLKYAPPPGRMRLIAGVKGTLIIDDTYNSSPRAAVAALETLGRLPIDVGPGLVPGRGTLSVPESHAQRGGGAQGPALQNATRQNATRYAVLADMLELGTLTEISHREVGRAAAEHADVLIGVGVSAQWTVEEAIKAGMSRDRVYHFHTLEQGLEHFLQERLQPGDVILVKGSQSMRMERLVKALMTEPLRAPELLCRQDKEWQP